MTTMEKYLSDAEQLVEILTELDRDMKELNKDLQKGLPE